jgi:hypothetical protein
VNTLIASIRANTTALSDAARHFTPNKKGNLPDKMQEVIEAMSSMGMAFRGTLGYEQILDYERFGQIDDNVKAMDVGSRILKGCVSVAEAQPFLVDILATLLQTSVAGITEAAAGKDDLSNMQLVRGCLLRQHHCRW